MSKFAMFAAVFIMVALVALSIIAPIMSSAVQAVEDTGAAMTRAAQMRQLSAFDAGNIGVEEASVGITAEDIDVFCRVYNPTGQMVEFCPAE